MSPKTVKKKTSKKDVTQTNSNKPDFLNMKLSETPLPSPEDVNTGEQNLDVFHLSNLDLQYLSTTIQHIQAELNLLIEARHAGNPEYESQITTYTRDLLVRLRDFIDNNKMI